MPAVARRRTSDPDLRADSRTDRDLRRHRAQGGRELAAEHRAGRHRHADTRSAKSGRSRPGSPSRRRRRSAAPPRCTAAPVPTVPPLRTSTPHRRAHAAESRPQRTCTRPKRRPRPSRTWSRPQSTPPVPTAGTVRVRIRWPPGPNVMTPVSNAVNDGGRHRSSRCPASSCRFPPRRRQSSDVLASIQNVLDLGRRRGHVPRAGAVRSRRPARRRHHGPDTDHRRGDGPAPADVPSPALRRTAPAWSALPQLPRSPPESRRHRPSTRCPRPLTPLDVTTTSATGGASSSSAAHRRSRIRRQERRALDGGARHRRVRGNGVADGTGRHGAAGHPRTAHHVRRGHPGRLPPGQGGVRHCPQTAISRFVGSGPIGVVRSSSQVELRSRRRRVTPVAAAGRRRPRPDASSARSRSTTQLLDHSRLATGPRGQLVTWRARTRHAADCRRAVLLKHRGGHEHCFRTHRR